MGTFFSPLMGFPFTWEVTGRLSVTDAGETLDISAVRDQARANVVMVSNAGPNTVVVNFGPTTVGATFPTADSSDGEGTVVLSGAIVILPCPPLDDCTMAAITDLGETAEVFVSRGWGQ